MNECPESARVGAYHDRELSAADRRRLEEHLASCPACTAELARLERLSGLLARGAQKAVPAATLARLHRSADQQPRLAVLHVAEAFAAIAAAVLLVSVIWLFELPTAQEASAQSPTWETVATASQDSAAAGRDQLAQLVEDLTGGDGP